jgi:hypothetical protein
MLFWTKLLCWKKWLIIIYDVIISNEPKQGLINKHYYKKIIIIFKFVDFYCKKLSASIMNEEANVNNIKRLQEKALLWRMVSL